MDNTHKLQFNSVLESIKQPLKFQEEFDCEYFGHFKNKGRSLENIEGFWLTNLYVEDPLELEQMSRCGLYEVLTESYIDEGSIIGLWG